MLHMANAEEYKSAGFVICKPGPRPSWNAPTLVPSLLISGSHRYCPTCPNSWLFDGADEKERAEMAAAFDLSGKRLEVFFEEVPLLLNQKGGFGWPGVFYSLDDARAFTKRYLGLENTCKLVLLELGLHMNLVQAFLIEAEPSDFNQGGEGGHYLAIMEQKTVTPGETLGFDVLGYECNGFCSWLVHGQEPAMEERFSFALNSRGLIDSEDVAIELADYYGSEESGAEPVLWLPWMMLQHPFVRR